MRQNALTDSFSRPSVRKSAKVNPGKTAPQTDGDRRLTPNSTEIAPASLSSSVSFS